MAEPPLALFVLSDKSTTNGGLPSCFEKSPVREQLRIAFVYQLCATSLGRKKYGYHALVPVTIADSKSPYTYALEKQYTDGPGLREIMAEGSKRPLPSTHVSSFAGRSLRDCARYLGDSPDDVSWDKEYFFALDDKCVAEATMPLVNAFESESGDIHAFLAEADQAVDRIMTMETTADFELKMQGYQSVMKRDGKADRSIIIPFEFPDSDDED
ncbi:hypothetical protein JX266_006307 [Neoarthrinium moseri]|nr:hypothetical protein JX266_006307 [Neoarthrinium moseri]